jgi:predicted TIM-barrel fold metal-dependent hydrolase
LSLKDNCLVSYLQELERMGVRSLKLEGRMKRPEYVAAVTGVYRRALDSGFVTQPMLDALMEAFNRQGFTDGYYTNRLGKNMFGIREENGEDSAWLRNVRKSYEAVENGLVGVKFHNDFQKYPIDDEKAIPMYREIAKRGLPVLLHMGDHRYDFSGPERLKNLMLRVPDLRVQAAHFGGWSVWDRVDCLPKDSERLVFDTCSSLAFMDKEMALRLIDHYGVEAFMFGTDFPMWKTEKEVERNLALGLSESENQMLFANNFLRFYNV